MIARRQLVTLGLTLGVAALVSVPSMAGAQATTWQKMSSRQMGTERRYVVELPASYTSSGTMRYPMLVVLDAETHVRHVASTARFLADQGDIPELIVVGVASGVRVHDYTQTDWPQAWIGGGGASKFKRFIVDELLPTLDAQLRTDGQRMLLGHSAAGQFALHLLATESAPFQGYLLMSPSLDWDGRLPVRELARAFNARDKLPGFLFVAEDPSLGQALNDQLALRQVLQDGAPRGLHWQVVNYPRETHGSVVLAATIDALRAAYHGYRLHPDEAPLLAELSIETGRDALADRYSLLSRHGRVVRTPEVAFHAVAEAHFRRNEIEAGILLLKRAAQEYPWSASSRRALADGLKRQQQAPPPTRP